MEPALEIITGAALSDAQLSMPKRAENASFYITLSGENHLDWLNILYEACGYLGIPSLPPKCTDSISKRRHYTRCYLHTRVHPILTELWHDFYQTGRKEVFPDLALTPLTLANWFTGDGGCYDGGRAACFATEGYSEASIAILRRKLREIGIYTSAHLNKVVKNGAGLSLWCTDISTVNALMDIVGPYVPPSYQYKVKRKKRERPMRIPDSVRITIPVMREGGMSREAVAHELGVSVSTVRNYEFEEQNEASS